MAKDGQKVAVRYRGTLGKNGKVFDETKGNKTFTFRLGELSTSIAHPCTMLEKIMPLKLFCR